MFNFPDNPQVGDTYALYKWDGEKWTCQAPPSAMGDPASNTNPLMNAVAQPGLTYTYARGDHVHPIDTSMAPTSNATLTGTPSTPDMNLSNTATINGVINAQAKGHLMGLPTGNAAAAINKADVNLLMYDGGVGSANWCGVGTDANGRWFVRTGTGGSPPAAIYVDQSMDCYMTYNYPQLPTAGVGDNSSRYATTLFVAQNPATGPFLPTAGGTLTSGIWYINGDLRTYRSDGTGVCFLGNSGARYIYFNGSTCVLNGAHAYSAAGRLWGTGDYGFPIVSERFAFQGDFKHTTAAGFQEPYGGGCVTGSQGIVGGGAMQRYRQFQACTSSWWGVGYA